jgi:hypothetical protein
MVRIYGFMLSNFLSRFDVRQSWICSCFLDSVLSAIMFDELPEDMYVSRNCMGPTAPRVIFLKIPPLRLLHLVPSLNNLLKSNWSHLSRFLEHRHFVFWGPSEGPIVLESNIHIYRTPDCVGWITAEREYLRPQRGAHVDSISYSSGRGGGFKLNPSESRDRGFSHTFCVLEKQTWELAGTGASLKYYKSIKLWNIFYLFHIRSTH